MSPSIRYATPGDANCMLTVQETAIRNHGVRSYSSEQVEAWAAGREPDDYPIESPETDVLVAERGGTVVGFGWLKPDADDYFDATVDGEITAVYVHSDITREGVGTLIYDELERIARAEGVRSLGLWASLNAVPFYESQGFEPVTRQSLEFEEGVSGEVLEMKKVLE